MLYGPMTVCLIQTDLQTKCNQSEIHIKGIPYRSDLNPYHAAMYVNTLSLQDGGSLDTLSKE